MLSEYQYYLYAEPFSFRTIQLREESGFSAYNYRVGFTSNQSEPIPLNHEISNCDFSIQETRTYTDQPIPPLLITVRILMNLLKHVVLG